jgi:Phosphoadenosine phosphosulfate reductase family
MAASVANHIVPEFRPDQLAFSFNGGKDSTAVLHLLLEAVQVWQEARGEQWKPSQGLLGLHTFYFETSDEFKEVLSFVEECDVEHHLCVKFYTCGFKEGLTQLLSEAPVKAIFIGTRHGDPNCKDQVSQLTSAHCKHVNALSNRLPCNALSIICLHVLSHMHRATLDQIRCCWRHVLR